MGEEKMGMEWSDGEMVVGVACRKWVGVLLVVRGRGGVGVLVVRSGRDGEGGLELWVNWSVSGCIANKIWMLSRV